MATKTHTHPGSDATPPTSRKACSREDLVAELEAIAQYLEILGENDFKIRAYRKGAEAVHTSSEPLVAIASGKAKVSGVGEGLRATIAEFLETGQTTQRQELKARVPDAVLELMKVRGLGPKRAFLIHQELGVSTIGELEYACRENRLASLKGVGKAVQDKLLTSIEEMALQSGKLRLDEALEKAAPLRRELEQLLGAKSEITPVGALARHAEVIERLEFLVVGEAAESKLKKVLAKLSGDVLTVHDDLATKVSKGEKIRSFNGTLPEGLALTIWLSETPPTPELSRWLWADPVARQDLEIEPAAYANWEPSWLEGHWTGTKRKPPVTAYRQGRDGHVRGIFHCHTDESDGRATLEDMVRAAEKLGYQYIGISDHSQSASYAGGLKPARLLEQRKRIETLQKKVSIRIFHGVESDILADGGLDYDLETLASFDFVVGSVHSRFKMNKAEMTERLMRALSNPWTTIWGHPTGRLLLARKPYEFDWDSCLDAAAKNGVAVEVNSNPQRLDLDWRLGAEVERRGLNLAIDPDAHDASGVADTLYGEWITEKAMVPRELILNMRNVDEMEKWLWERKKRASR